MFSQKEKDVFVSSYITAMLWSTGGTVSGVEYETLEEFELSGIARAKCREECYDFLTYAQDLIVSAIKTPGYSIEQAGHDFWFTRVGHGVGYWEKGLGDIGRMLTEASKTFGGVDPYVGDDGLVYI